MKNPITLFCISLTVCLSCQSVPKEEAEQIPKIDIEAAFAIEILDKQAHAVIDPNAKIELMASGFTWTEGPLWIPEEGGYLLFSDIPNNKVYKLDANRDTSTYLYPAGLSPESLSENEPGSNGLLLSPEGKLVLMQHGDRRVAQMEAPLSAPDENYRSLAAQYQGKRLNSPNDGAFDAAGNLYFSDPPYGLPGKWEDPNKELSFQGVYCLRSSGELILLDSLSKPNGIALSPDDKKLYVAVSDDKHAVWYHYDIVAAGEVSNKQIFYDVTHLANKEGQQGLPDGLKVNQAGYIFATGPAGVWIFTPDAKVLARIYTGQRTANCALTQDQKRLYMTADDYILSVPLL